MRMTADDSSPRTVMDDAMSSSFTKNPTRDQPPSFFEPHHWKIPAILLYTSGRGVAEKDIASV